MAPEHRERYRLLKNTDDERNKLIEELLDKNDKLKSDLDRTSDRLERDSDTVELYQQRSKEAIGKVDVFQKRANTCTYTCVLIDGDDLSFKEQFIQQGTSGGQDAAQRLHGAIKEYVTGLGTRQDCDIVVYMYANVYALARRYRDSQGDIDRFISGFNMKNPLLNLIDAGNTPGGVPSKIGELFRLHIKNLHCRHVVLGASTSDGYTTFLEDCIGDKNLENRITLLEGPPFSEGLSKFSDCFKKTSFPQVFRDSKTQVPNHPTQNQQNSLPYIDSAKPTAPEDRFLESLDDRRRHSTNGVINHDTEEQRNAAQKERRTSLRESVSEDTIRPKDRTITAARQSDAGKVAYPPDYFLDAPFGFVARNRNDQRIDVPLTRPDPEFMHEIKRRKLCNDFVFRQKCSNNPCRHEHPQSLTEKEFHALRDVARTFPCPTGVRCRDTLCCWGHRCPVDPCGFVHDRNCRYPPGLHETDTGIVNKEDIEKLQNGPHEEQRILGVKKRAGQQESPISQILSRSGETLYRNMSVAFDNTGRNGSKRVDSSQSSSLGKSLLNTSRKVSVLDPAPAAAVTRDPITPSKRTADEALGANRESKISPDRDPRVGAQKRLRGLSQ